MTSQELNIKIREVCTRVDIYECFGGKSIPYIGYKWNDIDFDAPTGEFGVLPEMIRKTDYKLLKQEIGFIGNNTNKWGYPIIKCSEEKWSFIKKLLMNAITNKTKDDFKLLYIEIQKLKDEYND